MAFLRENLPSGLLARDPDRQTLILDRHDAPWWKIGPGEKTGGADRGGRERPVPVPPPEKQRFSRV